MSSLIKNRSRVWWCGIGYFNPSLPYENIWHSIIKIRNLYHTRAYKKLTEKEKWSNILLRKPVVATVNLIIISIIAKTIRKREKVAIKMKNRRRPNPNMGGLFRCSGKATLLPRFRSISGDWGEQGIHNLALTSLIMYYWMLQN